MRIFFDTEFIESGRHHPIQLISIGLVREDGAEYYAISSEFDPASASQWVHENVLAILEPDVPRKRIAKIAEEIRAFVGDAPEFWAYYADYDWVVLCQMFGTMMDLPRGWPMYCRDVKQWADQRGATLPHQETPEHNALADARWNLTAWRSLAEGGIQ